MNWIARLWRGRGGRGQEPSAQDTEPVEPDAPKFHRPPEHGAAIPSSVNVPVAPEMHDELMAAIGRMNRQLERDGRVLVDKAKIGRAALKLALPIFEKSPRMVHLLLSMDQE